MWLCMLVDRIERAATLAMSRLLVGSGMAKEARAGSRVSAEALLRQMVEL